MSTFEQKTKRKIQYPFVVLSCADGWEVLFTATDRPYREAFFDTKEEALSFSEAKNLDWSKMLFIYYELINRIRDTIDSSHPIKVDSLAKRVWQQFADQAKRLKQNWGQRIFRDAERRGSR